MRKLTTIGKATCAGVALATLAGLCTFMDSQVDCCGDPIGEHIRFECGTIVRSNGTTATFRTEDGNEYICTQDRTPWNLYGYYNLQFDTRGTGAVYDDKIIKVWQEV